MEGRTDELIAAEAQLQAAEIALALNARARAENIINKQKLGSEYFVRLNERSAARRLVVALRSGKAEKAADLAERMAKAVVLRAAEDARLDEQIKNRKQGNAW